MIFCGVGDVGGRAGGRQTLVFFTLAVNISSVSLLLDSLG